MSRSEPLEVTVRRSGGVAGISRAWALAAADLPDPAAAELRRLVEEADPDLGSEPMVALPTLPDAFGYEVEVSDPTGRRRAAVDRATSPPAVRALLDFVLAAARGQTP